MPFISTLYAVLFVFLLVLSAPVKALAPGLALAQLQHAVWRGRDGAPGEIYAVAQTRDGFLWLGTGTGLYRFDGVRFDKVEALFGFSMPSNDVSALMADADGGLWVGYRFGGASLIRNGRVRHFQRDLEGNDSFPGNGSTRAFAVGKDGLVWCTADQLDVYQDGKWRVFDPALPKGNTSGLAVDSTGGVWAGLRDGIYRRGAGEAGFRKISPLSGLSFFAEGRDGTMWVVSDGAGLARFATADGSRLALPPSVAMLVLNGNPGFDRDGNLWIAESYTLARFTPAALRATDAAAAVAAGFERWGEKQGITGSVNTVAEDREGNVWVPASTGLNRFRAAALTPVLLPPTQGIGTAIAADPDGGVTVSHWSSGLYQVAATAGMTREDARFKAVSMMYRAPSGRLWAGNPSALWRRDGGAWSRIAWPVKSAQLVPQAAVEDGEGGLWVSLAFDGVHRYYQGHWQDQTSNFKLGNKTAYAMAADAAGTVWISYGRNNLFAVAGGRWRQFGAEQGLAAGTVLVITPSRDQLWLGGINAVVRYDGRRFRALNGRCGHPFRGVSGLVVTASGDIWMNGDDGVVHVAADEVRRWEADERYEVAFGVMDFADGLLGRAPHARPLPSAAQSTDGRLWFVTSAQVLVFDPARMLRNRAIPPVSITQVAVDGKPLPPRAPLVLPAGTQRVEIGFAGLSLAVPERNRYRYRLAGVDRDWVSGDGRRSVAYTNLSPGSYRFEVYAANNDDVWNPHPATLALEVLPAYYQSTWFRALLALLAATAIWLLYRWRMRQLTRLVSERLQSQHLERVRIARELHDTLLQGVGSLSMVVRGAIQRAGAHPVAPLLSQGLRQAEAVIAEGRHRVTRLRVAAEHGDLLVEELGMLGAELAAGGATRFEIVLEGQPCLLASGLFEESRCIMREAVWNAFQHAQAGLIQLTLSFGRRALTMRVRDDGIGLPAGVTAQHGRAGHWGLPGMAERAARIGGSLQIQSEAGVTVILTIPASLAYQRH
jgi:signal transduction histidine kinase/ligand-binding sensor domain-containing protein